MTIKTRKEVREALGALLSTEMAGAGNPVQAVYDYLKGTFDGQSPVVVVGSAGIEGAPMTFQGSRATYYFSILTFVTREGEETAEDALDEVAQKLFEVMAANRRKTGDWQFWGYDGRSRIEPASVGGDPYWMEMTPVMVEVF